MFLEWGALCPKKLKKGVREGGEGGSWRGRHVRVIDQRNHAKWWIWCRVCLGYESHTQERGLSSKKCDKGLSGIGSEWRIVFLPMCRRWKSPLALIRRYDCPPNIATISDLAVSLHQWRNDQENLFREWRYLCHIGQGEQLFSGW